MHSIKRPLVIAAVVVAALAVGCLVWIFVLPGPSLLSATSESGFRRACASAGGTVILRKYGMGSDTLICLSGKRYSDAGAPCATGRPPSCQGRCYTLGSGDSFVGDLEIGGAKGTCSEHPELGSWPVGK